MMYPRMASVANHEPANVMGTPSASRFYMLNGSVMERSQAAGKTSDDDGCCAHAPN